MKWPRLKWLFEGAETVEASQTNEVAAGVLMHDARISVPVPLENNIA